MEIQDGLTLTLGGTTLALAVKEVFGWLRARNQRTEITPNPLPVDGEIAKKPAFVPVAECNRRMCEHAERMTRLEGEVKASNAAVIKKLDEIDTRAEERALATHRRLDPIVGKVAANSEAIENIKRLAFNSTMGGHK